jgi:hypothetical protein
VSIARTLTLTAEAHIVEDLSDSLYELELQLGVEVEKEKYEKVVDLIISCLEEVGRKVETPERLREHLAISLCSAYGVI